MNGAGSHADLLGGQLDHEPGAGFTVAPILDANVAAMEPNMFVDERQAEPRAVARAATAGHRAAGEAFEDEVALLHGNACAVILDGDPDMAERFAVVLCLGNRNLRIA